MANQKLVYAGVAAETITLASLGNNTSQEGTFVNNTAALNIDYIVSGKITTGVGVSVGDAFLWLSSGDGTTPSAPATGTNNAIIIPLYALGLVAQGSILPGGVIPGTQLVYLTRLPCTGLAAASAVGFANLSVAQAFGGQVPPTFAVGVTNMTGQALNATGGNHVVNTNGVFYSIV